MCLCALAEELHKFWQEMSPARITGARARFVQFHFFDDQIIKTIEVGRLEIPLCAELNRLHILQKTQMLIFVNNISECCNFLQTAS